MNKRERITSLFAVAVLCGGTGAWAMLDGPTHEPLDQNELTDLVKAGQDEEAFEEAFELGDEMFERQFNSFDGVGAFVAPGVRFTRVPRADRNGPGEWANHTPRRATGPNAQNCNACHRVPFDDGAGENSANVHRDPEHSAVMNRFIQRNTPHVFAPGAIQKLAEEMTDKLHALRDRAKERACRHGNSGDVALSANGISFGSISAKRTGTHPCAVEFDNSKVEGVDADLVIKPFQWKGAVAFLRDFNRGASHNELGMQPVEIAGHDVDGDFDGVKNELTIGDQTALAVYLAAQPRPTSKLELNQLGLLDPPLTGPEIAAIRRGSHEFTRMKCASCHTPFMKLDKSIFREPSANPHYRDATFPAGQNPLAEGLDPKFPVSFDLTQDQPDNIIEDENGNVVFRLGSLRKSGGKALVELFGDLKRHDLGADVAENIDEVGTGPSVFLTENLWGVGSTAPYMHDGRATTLTEAIAMHGGEAAAARAAFNGASEMRQSDLLAFLKNLVLFKMEEE